LAAGELSQRKIAELTGISRGTVGAISTGKRSDYQSRPPSGKETLAEADGPLQRCPGCGGMVNMPCRLCRARAIKSNHPASPIPLRTTQSVQPLGLDLNDEHRFRYEQVRAQRAEAEKAALRPVNEEAEFFPEESEIHFDDADFNDAMAFDDTDPFDEANFADIDDWDDLQTATI